VLGVGSAVNRTLSAALARAGRGAEVLVGPDEDAERAAKRLVDRTKRPILTDVSIFGSAVIDHAPAFLPDVFEGAPLVAAVALRSDGGELVVRGETAHERWEQKLRVPAQAIGTGNQAIVALYGREHVADLEARWLERHDAEIEATGLAFQIATRMTSWVAVDESRKVTGRARDQAIPQELPYGTQAEAFGLRPGMVATMGESPMFEGDLEAGYLSDDFGEVPKLAGELFDNEEATGQSLSYEKQSKSEAKTVILDHVRRQSGSAAPQSVSVDAPAPAAPKRGHANDRGTTVRPTSLAKRPAGYGGEPRSIWLRWLILLAVLAGLAALIWKLVA
jgi:Ca-activated chloride channel family protein